MKPNKSGKIDKKEIAVVLGIIFVMALWSYVVYTQQ